MRPIAGWLMGGAAVLLPWVTWWKLLTPNPHVAVGLTPHWLLAMALLGIVAAWVWQRDAWLGLMGAYWILWGIPAVHLTGSETVFFIVIGTAAIVAVRELSVQARTWLCRALLFSGACQVAYVGLQALGYDPLWPPGPGTAPLRLVGTLGNSDWVAAYLALLSPLAPWWLLPVFGLGLWLTKSAAALVAATVGVLVSWRIRWPGWALAGCAIFLALSQYPHLWESFRTRWHAWEPALVHQNVVTLWIGHGPGAWTSLAPLVWGELYLQAHNEYLQWWYEGGLCAVLLAAGWVWFHQRLLAQSRYAGTILALAISSLFMFPLHVAPLAAVGIVSMGWATSQPREGP